MPPCAATVCERVGKTLVMQAVCRPFWRQAEGGAQAGAAGADHDHVVLVFGDLVGSGHGSGSQRDADDGDHAGDARARTQTKMTASCMPTRQPGVWT